MTTNTATGICVDNKATRIARSSRKLVPCKRSQKNTFCNFIFCENCLNLIFVKCHLNCDPDGPPGPGPRRIFQS